MYVCEAKISGSVSCDSKYTRADLGMKIQKHEITNKTRYYCRYIPKSSNEGKDESLNSDNPFLKSFGPELILSQRENIPGNLHWYHSLLCIPFYKILQMSFSCWNIVHLISKYSFEDKNGNATNFKQRKAVFAPGSFFYPTLIFGDEIDNIPYGDVSLKFRDQPFVDIEGMDYAPTDFIWV